MYGVGGIPHTQWNGVEKTVGGYPNGNWQPMYNTFLPIYNGVLGEETPYSIEINGMVNTSSVDYDITVSMDADQSSTNQQVYIFLVEDNIYSFWGAVGQYHDARNVNRDWKSAENLTINTSGESQTLSGTFDLSKTWVMENVKIIAIVQNSSSKKIFQVGAVLINDDTFMEISSADVVGIPGNVSIGQLYPNPFNPVCSIPITLPNKMDVRIQVFDIQGRHVATLINEHQMTTGNHVIKWNASNFSSGVYFIQIQTSAGIDVRKAYLVK